MPIAFSKTNENGKNYKPINLCSSTAMAFLKTNENDKNVFLIS